MDLVPALSAADLAGGGGLAMAASAVVLGASGSFHCLLMCGPLACAASAPAPVVHSIGKAPPQHASLAPVAYQTARIAAYVMMGGALGAFGSALSRLFTLPLRSVLPWVLVAALVAAAFELGKRVAPIPGFANIMRMASRIGASISPAARAALIGGITPLLPCGLLYSVFAAAFAAGSFAGGAILLGCFAIGGVPALLLAQLALAGRARRVRGWPALVVEKGIPLVAAAMIALRALESAHDHACH